MRLIAIALKALNERWKALNDPSKSQLPKSFPQTTAGKQPVHQGGFSHHGHSHERKVIPKFNIDEIMKPIPLPGIPLKPGIMVPLDEPSTSEEKTTELSSSND